MAEALYRKYRPKVFEDVVGQEHIQRTLKNAIASDKVSHAYLFTGPRGTGKTSTARLLAKALLCQTGDGKPTPDPDGTCEDCLLVAEGEHPDVSELDAASRTGVENVREEIIGRVHYAPTRGEYKIYIIDEVHMLSTAAFNALLKTLEEPPEHVVFVLCTTDPQKVPETIHSRCQRFDFRRISNEELVSRLGAICEMEGIPFEGDALDLVAHRAEGGMRDALTSLEQLVSFGGGNVTVEQAERLLGTMDSSDLSEIVDAVGKRDAAAAFRWTSEYMETGADLAQFTQELSQRIRNMYVMSLVGADVALEVPETARREMESELAMFGPDRLANILLILGDLAADLKTSSNQRLTFEIALTRMVRPDSDLTLEALAERIEALEAGRSATVSAAVTASPTAATAASAVQASPSMQPETVAQAAPGFAESTTEPPASATAPGSAPAGTSVSPTASDGAAAAATAVGSSAATTLPSDPSAVAQIWNTAMAHLKKAGGAYPVLFMDTAKSVDPATGAIVVRFDGSHTFQYNAAQKPDVRQALADALAKAGAPGVPVRIEMAGSEKPAVAQVAAEPAGEDAAAVAVERMGSDAAVETSVEPSDSNTAVDEVSATVQAEDAADGSSSVEEHVPLTPEEERAEVQNTTDALNDALAAAFGDGISFEQVD